MAPSAAATEFRATFGAPGLAHIARWFNVSQRSVRRWRDHSRPTPRGAALVLRLLAEGTITTAQVEQAAAAISTPTISGSAAPEPLPPVEPKPKQSAPARAEVAAFAGLSPAAAPVVALDAKCCHWPIGDPQHIGFHFCGCPATTEPYCAHHRKQAYLAPRTDGVRVGFVAHWRHGPTGAARAPKIPLDRAGALPGSAPPPA